MQPLATIKTMVARARHGNPLQSVHVSLYSTFAVGRDGSVYAWGRGDQGELGVQDADRLEENEEGELYSITPLRIELLLSRIRISVLSASLHVLALGDSFTVVHVPFTILKHRRQEKIKTYIRYNG